ncbi:hypothetical protein B0T17DRAFT_222911 [Bombardia bombarda]|uniref:Uncharacterized protein n=1 Tax=Bombardia bombarda TaxID=252184 RepID=A0AA40C9X0_9PEZI|nr:hypothetical protein B0T17DRAFT_222911 [Bombardia bombarda]
MTNNLAAFLGDSHFPNIIMSASQGEKIIRLLNLFKTYSSLAFTNPRDPPTAVDGIQNRLLKAFKTQGRYGIFGQDVDESNKNNNLGQRGLLRRTLLWHRRHENKDTLVPIDFPPAKKCRHGLGWRMSARLSFSSPGLGAPTGCTFARHGLVLPPLG